MLSNKVVEKASQFVASTSYDEIPEESIKLIEQAFLDTIGVTIAGSTEGAGKIAAETMIDISKGMGGEFHILGREETTGLFESSFVNGTASHCHDFDDYAQEAMNAHPSAPLVPAILAIAEMQDISGKDAITSYAVGFEIMSYFGRPIQPSHFEAGWHVTGTIGTFGAAAAAASLLDLGEETSIDALGIAASMVAGLRQNFGTMAKPMHVGNAARSGLTAALLANNSFTSSQASLVGEDGFYDAYSGDGEADQSEFHDLGQKWALEKFGIHSKKYPTCAATHTSIAAGQSLVEEQDVNPEEIEQVNVRASKLAGDALLYDDPTSGLEGKFSMPYTVACAIVQDVVGLDLFYDENIHNLDIQNIRQKVSFEVDNNLPYYTLESSVSISTRDGNVYEKTIEHPPGSYQNPMSRAEYHEKFMRCTTRAVDESVAQEALDFLDSLHKQEDIGHLFTIL